MEGDIYCAANQLPDGRKYYYCRQRYVLGRGLDFHGVWDRLAPDAPIGRFPKDGQGWRASRRKWADLMNDLSEDEVVVVRSKSSGRPRSVAEVPQAPEGWTFAVEEQSGGVWLARGTNVSGRSVQVRGTDPDGLLVECRRRAQDVTVRDGA